MTKKELARYYKMPLLYQAEIITTWMWSRHRWSNRRPLVLTVRNIYQGRQ